MAIYTWTKRRSCENTELTAALFYSLDCIYPVLLIAAITVDVALCDAPLSCEENHSSVSNGAAPASSVSTAWVFAT